jgi:poly(A) polymerase
VTQHTPQPQAPARTVFPRSEHRISRADISDNALKVLNRLHAAGYEAYLVGGCVRDLSLGREPKDFDVATDARPEEVRALFRNCRLIGRRFRLAHVHFGREIIEVATFRASHDGADADSDAAGEHNGMLVRDNVYGSVDEDALRRDFTINCLYYNIADFSVVDFANGMDDLEEGVVRLIGSAEERYREDPVRMLRAVRFAAKLGFRIDPAAAAMIPRMAGLLEHVPKARLFEEVLKLFMGGHGAQAFDALRRYRLFDALFPDAVPAIEDGHGSWTRFINAALSNTDHRLAEGKPVTPAFLFAALLWPGVRHRYVGLLAEGLLGDAEALDRASATVLERQLERVLIPKRFSLPMREIHLMQSRLEAPGRKGALRLLGHPRFRAAYDFLLLRAEVGDADPQTAQWWTQAQLERDADPHALPPALDTPPPRRRARRPRRRPAS